MNLLLISQNLVHSRLVFPRNAVLRINLAWHKNLTSLSKMLDEHKGHDIFLDIPVGRKKPPNHKHDLCDVAEFAANFSCVKYIAISNVETPESILEYQNIFKCKIVPKIETYKGVVDCEKIIDALNYTPQILMLDHEDLFSNLVFLGKEKHYLEVMDILVNKCRVKNACLLRAQGIIFSGKIKEA
jgi:hypothetical protein